MKLSLSEKIAVKVLPRIWAVAFQRIEKLDLITRALEVCWKNKLMRKTWMPFCNNITSWLRDGLREVEQCRKWYAER